MRRKFLYRFVECTDVDGLFGLCGNLQIYDPLHGRLYEFACAEQLDFMCLKNAAKLIKYYEQGVIVMRVHATYLLVIAEAKQ